MATTKTLTPTVEYGSVEYFCGLDVTANGDVLELEFDEPFILDDLIVSCNDAYKIEIEYPASGVTCDVKAASSGTFELNNYSSYNKWYRIPANAKLRMEVTGVTPNSFLKAMVLGRG